MRWFLIVLVIVAQADSLSGGVYNGNGIGFTYDDTCHLSENHDNAFRVRLQCGGDVFTAVIIGQKPGPVVIRLVNFRLLSSLIDRLEGEEKKTVTVVSEGDIDFIAGQQTYRARERVVMYREGGRERRRREIMVLLPDRIYMIIRAGDRDAPDTFRSTIDTFRIHAEP